MKQKLTLVLLGPVLTAAALSTAAAQTGQPAAPSPVQPQTEAAPASQPVALPDTAANYVAYGNLYYGQGKYDQAYVAYRAAVELEPRRPDALLGLGRAQVRLRLFAPALETLTTLLSADPQGLTGYLTLAQAYQAHYLQSSDRTAVKNNLANALKVLQDAEYLASAQGEATRALSLSRVLNERGQVYRLQGETAKAIEEFKKASSLSPQSSEILFNLGDMYYAAGDLTQALRTLQQSVTLNPDDAYNRAYYAKLLAQSGYAAVAKPEAAQAARTDPGNAYAVGQYGVVSYLAQDPTTARAQLEQAVKLAPLGYPEFYYYLGRLDLDNSNLKSAREQFTRAVTLNAGKPEYLYYLGLSFERGAGDVAPDKVKARENYQRALRLQPNYKAAQTALERVK